MYGFSLLLTGEFNAIVERVVAALKAEGFGVLTEIDVQATMKAKLGEEMPPYRILGACNPALAHQVLSIDPEVGLLLPCNVVVRGEAEGGVRVSIVDPQAMMSVVNHPQVEEIAAQVAVRLLRVKEQLAAD